MSRDDELGTWVREVLELASHGKCYKEIAQAVGVTEQAIKNIAHRHMRDHAVENIAHAVAEAIRKGWIK